MKAVVAGLERHAIHRGVNGVECDVPGCAAKLNVDRGNAEQARAEAAAKGWTVRAGDAPMDLCPKHGGWK